MQRVSRLLIFSVLIGLCVHVAAQATEKLGVILLHGKQGTPAQMGAMALALQAAGHLTEAPELCWSRSRIYDRTYLECVGEIDAAAQKLKQRGATAIALVAQSTGSNAAFGYAARRSNLKAVAVMVPASNPTRMQKYPSVAKSLQEARALVAAGRGDIQTMLADNNNGKDIAVRTTPKIYLSWYGPESAGTFENNLARIGAPLLWLMSAGDPARTGVSEATQRQMFSIAKNPKNRFAVISAGHFEAPNASADLIVSWLKALNGR